MSHLYPASASILEGLSLETIKTQIKSQWLTPLILAAQEAEVRKLVVLRQMLMRPYLEKAI
jgi:hypothetical protein